MKVELYEKVVGESREYHRVCILYDPESIIKSVFCNMIQSVSECNGRLTTSASKINTFTFVYSFGITLVYAIKKSI